MSIPYKRIEISIRCLKSTAILNISIDNEYLPDVIMTQDNELSFISWHEKCTFQGPRYVKIKVRSGTILLGQSSQMILTPDGSFIRDCKSLGETKQNQVLNGKPVIKDIQYLESGMTGEWHHELSSNDVLEFDYIVEDKIIYPMSLD